MLDTAGLLDGHWPAQKSASSSSDGLRKGTRHPDWVESTRNSRVQEHAVETPLHDLAGVRRKSDAHIGDQVNLASTLTQFT